MLPAEDCADIFILPATIGVELTTGCIGFAGQCTCVVRRATRCQHVETDAGTLARLKDGFLAILVVANAVSLNEAITSFALWWKARTQREAKLLASIHSVDQSKKSSL